MYQKFLRNQTQELKGNIRVFCRVRPVIPAIDDNNDLAGRKSVGEVINIPSLHKIEIIANAASLKEDGPRTGKNAPIKQSFEFDVVFGPKSAQEDLFKEVYHLVMSALDGYKVCIFSYGQTGSGKTYTMEGDFGNPKERGIIPRAVEALFENISNNEQQKWTYEIETSFQEIYGEQIRDLLSPERSMRQLNKASEYEPTTVIVKNVDDVYTLLEKARENRVVAETSCNESSSRSHSIFQLLIKGIPGPDF